jgi:hypothetical protein
VTVGTVKKSNAAMASRRFARNVRQQPAGSPGRRVFCSWRATAYGPKTQTKRSMGGGVDDVRCALHHMTLRSVPAGEGIAGWLQVLTFVQVRAVGYYGIALPCVWGLGRLVESQLYEIKATDPATVGVATLVLCSAAVGAALVPARRASTVNPSEALRFE